MSMSIDGYGSVVGDGWGGGEIVSEIRRSSKELRLENVHNKTIIKYKETKKKLMRDNNNMYMYMYIYI